MDRPEYLAAFYKEITNEIRRLREEQWKLSYYFIVEAVGVIYLFVDLRLEKYVNLYVAGAALVIQALCVIFYVYHLHLNHQYVGRSRVTRRKLECYFGLHEIKIGDSESLVPNEWKDLKISKWFEYNTVVLPLALFVAGVQVTSIYIVVLAGILK